MSPSTQTFDGHNDVALRLFWNAATDPGAAFLSGRPGLHIDLPKAKAGALVGGFFALYSPSSTSTDYGRMKGPVYDFPQPPMLALPDAQAPVLAMLSLLLRVERESNGAVMICRSVAELRASIARGVFAILIHLEGADAIDDDLYFLDVLHAAGLRSLGPVWSRNTIFGHGVVSRFPGSPDCGPGLTEAGKRLVSACNRLGVVIDLSHITEQGFWDVARLSSAPLVATHSNAHSLCPSTRNLTDRQLDAIKETGGVVGLCYATSFLRPDGSMNEDTDLELMVRHCSKLIERLGEDGVAMGSDFDGCIVPKAIGSAAGLPALYEAFRRHGYDEPLLGKIGSLNWLRVLERTIG